MKETDFFKRLYRGFEAENLIAGKLFGSGLEALKLPADFGFDLLVSNQMERSLGSEAASLRTHELPYVLQVKSRRMTSEHFEPKNDRLEGSTNFWISEDEYQLLTKEEKSYLVLVIFLPQKERTLSSRQATVWFKGSQLAALRDLTYLEPMVKDGRRFYDLCVVVRMIRKVRTETFLKGLLADDEISEKALEAILSTFPDEYVPDKSAEYVSLARRSFSKDDTSKQERSAIRRVQSCHTDISLIGCEVDPLGVMDNNTRPSTLPLLDFP